MALRIFASVVCVFVCATALPTFAAAQPQAANPFGTTEQIPFALKGDIYFLPAGAQRLPDFAQLRPTGSLYVNELNVPERAFDAGFPGISNRFEDFAIDYNGNFLLSQGGTYRFRLTSDDGSKLYIDDKVVIDNDGGHRPRAYEGSVQLTPGLHKIRVSYFQGPRYHIALVLEVARQAEPYRVFSAREFAPAEVTEVNGQLKLDIGDAILFDFDKAVLKPAAATVLSEIKSSILDKRPSARITIGGHTDDKGTDAYNVRLSQSRADAVANWLAQNGIARAQLTVQAHGEALPKVPNTSDENRAKNRRVEISVQN